MQPRTSCAARVGLPGKRDRQSLGEGPGPRHISLRQQHPKSLLPKPCCYVRFAHDSADDPRHVLPERGRLLAIERRQEADNAHVEQHHGSPRAMPRTSRELPLHYVPKKVSIAQSRLFINQPRRRVGALDPYNRRRQSPYEQRSPGPGPEQHRQHHRVVRAMGEDRFGRERRPTQRDQRGRDSRRDPHSLLMDRVAMPPRVQSPAPQSLRWPIPGGAAFGARSPRQQLRQGQWVRARSPSLRRMSARHAIRQTTLPN